MFDKVIWPGAVKRFDSIFHSIAVCKVTQLNSSTLIYL